MAIGWINIKKSGRTSLLLKYCNKKDNPPINIQAGVIQINKVRIANGMPPRLYPISVSV